MGKQANPKIYQDDVRETLRIDGDIEFSERACDVCKGKGKISGQPCLNCGGHGIVFLPRWLVVTPKWPTL